MWLLPSHCSWIKNNPRRINFFSLVAQYTIFYWRVKKCTFLSLARQTKRFYDPSSGKKSYTTRKKKFILRVRNLMPELHIQGKTFFLLSGHKVDFIAPRGTKKSFFRHANKKKIVCDTGNTFILLVWLLPPLCSGIKHYTRKNKIFLLTDQKVNFSSPCEANWSIFSPPGGKEILCN